MGGVVSFVRGNPQGVFWACAYLIGGGGYALSTAFPSDFWPFVLWGIALAGLLVTAIADGRAGVRTYLARIVRVRAGVQWYAVALLTPFVLAFAAAGLVLATGGSVTGGLPSPGTVVPLFLLFFLTTGMEEPGFRGFSLPRLLCRHSAATASLVLGVLHALWHLPLYLGGDQELGDFLHPLCGAFLFTWIFVHTGGSVFLAMLLHASNDVAGHFVGSLFTGADATRYSLALGAAFVVMAVLLRALTGRELGRRPE
jgi:CAAX protease family protein